MNTQPPIPEKVMAAGRKAARPLDETERTALFLSRALKKLNVSESDISNLGVTEKAALMQFISQSIVDSCGN